MTIDFSALVLAPAQDVFGAPVVVTPYASQPQQPAYSARGIWSVKSVDIITEDGGVVSDRETTLSIRLAEFQIAPSPGDWITTQVANMPVGLDPTEFPPGSVIDFVIDDTSPDGQGELTLTVKRRVT
ncbi:MAG TPA: hypothetical protein VGH62_01380 [Bradyrhizobium sp.]|jgi:hypothetical protein